MAEAVSSVALFAFVILPVAVTVMAWGVVLGVERYGGAKPGPAEAQPSRRVPHPNRSAARGRR
jgi:hypothetical protein